MNDGRKEYLQSVGILQGLQHSLVGFLTIFNRQPNDSRAPIGPIKKSLQGEHGFESLAQQAARNKSNNR